MSRTPTTITVPTPGATPPPPGEDEGTTAATTPDERVKRSPLATLMLALAIGLLVAIRHYGPDSAVATYGYGVWLTVLVLSGALIASLWPTVLTREGLVLLWNGLGLSLGLLAIGLLGVSSLLALPPVLLGLAASAWPRWPGQPLAPVFDRSVLVGGILVLPLLAAIEWLWL